MNSFVVQSVDFGVKVVTVVDVVVVDVLSTIITTLVTCEVSSCTDVVREISVAVESMTVRVEVTAAIVS